MVVLMLMARMILMVIMVMVMMIVVLMLKVILMVISFYLRCPLLLWTVEHGSVFPNGGLSQIQNGIQET